MESFHPFQSDISTISLPEKFTFPFYYEPHPLSLIAANELQHYLGVQTDFDHHFGFDENPNSNATGKMFGVLVVQNQAGELGHLWAFSGKLADTNDYNFFVPAVFDMLEENSFFIIGIKELTAINTEVERLENHPDFISLSEKVENERALIATKLKAEQIKLSASKKERAGLRKKARQEISDPAELEIKLNQLVRESQQDQFMLKEYEEYLGNKLSGTMQKLNIFSEEINHLKQKRRTKSAALQKQLFDEYAFLNQAKELKNLNAIFDGTPPSGAGECAAPKLLHHAFKNDLKPIAMAEFWWGQSPKSEIRRHRNFYPACMGKCEPILKHMLSGMNVEDNPFLANPKVKELEIVFEDDYLLVVNKPADFLSVPGKQIADSVALRMRYKYPDATGPLIVHRLDMATSGLLLVAKSMEVYQNLQRQFIKRKVQKRYVALLDGIVKEDNGTIELPLRVDLDNRPSQLVCHLFGKKARTRWEVIKRTDKQTLVYFYPITGRTHQLRVHAAHPDGLNAPIIGDNLYGHNAKRLYLHAESITFQHPVLKENMTVSTNADFDL
ncbi:MAG: pseudouridine synthase [Flavobacterium sp.]